MIEHRLYSGTKDDMIHACMEWHYAKKIPTGKRYIYRATERGVFVGVIIINNGSGPWLGHELGIDRRQIYELIRVAFTTHEIPVSRWLSIAVKMFKAECPEASAIYSFADTFRGHIGGIYKASNWLYLGEAKGSGSKTILVDGEWIPTRTYYDNPAKYTGSVVIKKTPKHKYLLPITAEAKVAATRLSKKYPAQEA